MYEEIGDMIRYLCRELQHGNYEEEEWKNLIRKAEKERNRREGSGAE